MTDQISLNIALTLAGILAGVAIAWGVLRQSVIQLQAVATTLTADVVSLRADLARVERAVAEMRAREEGFREAKREITERHDVPGRPPRDPRRE